MIHAHHAFKKDKAGKPLTRKISKIAWQSLSFCMHQGEKYDKQGWIKGTAEDPPEAKEAKTAKKKSSGKAPTKKSNTKKS